jgi:tetratricopeptide (TPR) repeat protein
MADLGPGAVVGWLRAHATADDLAGCAFLIGPDIVLTCAHVVGAHLGLPKPVPKDPPADPITIRFEALQDELTGHVLPGGWFSNERPAPGDLSDIAVVYLDKPVEAISPLPAIAQRLPTQSRPVLIHGAEADYKSYGQQVPGEMSGSNIPRGWRQIDPTNSVRGFTVKNGFSGSPVLDDTGNVVWGMVVAVAEQGSGVAYAIAAENLWAALQSAGADTTVRIPDSTDRQSEAAMTALREEYEIRLAERESETARMQQELDQLRRTVRGLGQEARESPDEQAGTALKALTTGDKLPAVELLRHRMEELLAAAGEARGEAAAMARQLGTMLSLVDSTGALKAFWQATECDPGDFWTWVEIARLEQVAGTLDGARKAIDAGLLVEAVDERDRAVALDDLGDVLVAQGDLPAALKSFRDGLAIRERLAQSDRGNAGWQRDLSVSYDRVGDVLVAQGDLPAALKSFRDGLAIRERLAQSDRGNAGWQRDLSVSLNKIGDVLVAQGDLPAALKSFRDGLAIRERLAQSDRGNAGWQRDLALSYGRVAMVEARQGLREDALGGFRRGRDIISRLARQSPSNAALPNDLAWFEGQIAAYEK